MEQNNLDQLKQEYFKMINEYNLLTNKYNELENKLENKLNIDYKIEYGDKIATLECLKEGLIRDVYSLKYKLANEKKINKHLQKVLFEKNQLIREKFGNPKEFVKKEKCYNDLEKCYDDLLYRSNKKTLIEHFKNI